MNNARLDQVIHFLFCQCKSLKAINNIWAKGAQFKVDQHKGLTKNFIFSVE